MTSSPLLLYSPLLYSYQDDGKKAGWKLYQIVEKSTGFNLGRKRFLFSHDVKQTSLFSKRSNVLSKDLFEQLSRTAFLLENNNNDGVFISIVFYPKIALCNVFSVYTVHEKMLYKKMFENLRVHSFRINHHINHINWKNEKNKIFINHPPSRLIQDTFLGNLF